MGKVDLSNLASALKEERTTLGFTQKQAAEKLQISLKSLRNLEQGYSGVTLETASQILRLFGKEIRVGDIVVPKKSKVHKRPRRDEVLRTLRLIKPVLESKFKVQKIYLFGSCARDEAKKNSDIDIALSFKETPSFSTIGKISVFLDALFEESPVDVVELEKMNKEVLSTAKKDFIRV